MPFFPCPNCPDLGLVTKLESVRAEYQTPLSQILLLYGNRYSMSTLLFLVLGRAEARRPLPLGWPMDEAPTSVCLSFPSWPIPAPTHNGHAQYLSFSTFARAHTGLSTVGSWGLTRWTRRPGPILWEPVYAPRCRAWGLPGWPTVQSNSSCAHWDISNSGSQCCRSWEWTYGRTPLRKANHPTKDKSTWPPGLYQTP